MTGQKRYVFILLYLFWVFFKTWLLAVWFFTKGP